jgi:hypothetical protein
LRSFIPHGQFDVRKALSAHELYSEQTLVHLAATAAARVARERGWPEDQVLAVLEDKDRQPEAARAAGLWIYGYDESPTREMLFAALGLVYNGFDPDVAADVYAALETYPDAFADWARRQLPLIAAPHLRWPETELAPREPQRLLPPLGPRSRRSQLSE